MRIYKGQKPYIFVSYSHADSERVLPMLHDLQQQGFRLWYDEGIEVGAEWPDYVAEHLINSTWVIAFLSKHAIASQNCRQELFMARNRQKNMLVVYLEKTELPSGLEMMLGPLHALYCENHKDDTAVWESLASASMLQSCKDPEASPEPADDPGLESELTPLVDWPVLQKIKRTVLFVLLAIIALLLYTAVSHFSGDDDQKISDLPPEEILVNIASAEIGDYVAFGDYEQDNDLMNGTERIRWKVLDKQEDALLLISAQCLDVSPYHSRDEVVAWDECTIRDWLHTAFADEAFTEKERIRIMPVENTTAKGSHHLAYGQDVDTVDYVFLLSQEEAAIYMPLEANRAAEPTDYAAAKGGSDNLWWMLRSPKSYSNCIACVNSWGEIRETGLHINGKGSGLRPAMWITTESLENKPLKYLPLDPDTFTP